MVKDNAKIGISGNLSEILISFWVAVFFHDNRMRKSPGLALPLVLLWDKLCRIGPIDSCPSHSKFRENNFFCSESAKN